MMRAARWALLFIGFAAVWLLPAPAAGIMVLLLRPAGCVRLTLPCAPPPPPARPARQALMRAQLQRIKDTEGLSDNVFEIVAKSLKED